MPETFLILLAGGIMLAAAVSRASQVTLNWLRLCGILALAMSGVGLFFYFSRHGSVADFSPTPPVKTSISTPSSAAASDPISRVMRAQ